MITQKLGKSGLDVTRIAYGCMTISGGRGPVSEDIRRMAFAALDTAVKQGINFFDHADIYGRGRSEEVFGEWLAANPGTRGRIFLQSKCGIRPAAGDEPLRYDFSHEHITRSVEGSLKRLGVDCLDVLLLHRPDVLAEPEEVARAFDDLHAAGKVRHFGVSNHSSHQMDLFRRHVRQPLVANQLELSLLHTRMLDDGVEWNRRQYEEISSGTGTLEYCRLHEVTIQAWSPLARGLLTGRACEPTDPRADRVRQAAPRVAELAKAKGVPGEAIVIAWLLRHPAGIQPVIGTRDPGRIAACAKACDVTLTREEWYALYAAARGHALP